jgi:hypothetical protein
MPPRGTTGRSLSTKALTPGSSEQRAYETKRDRAFKAALRSEAEGKASPVAKKSVSYGGQQSIAQTRALRSASVPRSMRSPYYMTNPTVTRPQRMTKAQADTLRSRGVKALPKATGEESVRPRQKLTSLTGGLGMQAYGPAKGVYNTRTPRDATQETRDYQYGEVLAAPQAKAARRKATTINIPGGGLRTGAKAKAPARMAVNPRTGSTLGFTTGSRTGSTATKAGVAGKTKMSGSQRMAQNAFNKGGVAGPRKDSSGRNVSSASGKKK